MNRTIRRRAARLDLIDIVHYYIGRGSPATGHRFRIRAEALFQQLAAMPGMGARFDPGHPALAELRFVPITRFNKYLVFYRPIVGGIDVVRVLHGARDVAEILTDEFADGEDEDLAD